MATVQSVQQNNGVNYAVPAAIGGAVAGGLAGAFVPKMPLVPAKYKSAQELIDAINGKDKIQISLSKDANEKVQIARELFQSTAEDIKSVSDTMSYLFKDKEIISKQEFQSALGYPNGMQGIENEIAEGKNLLSISEQTFPCTFKNSLGENIITAKKINQGEMPIELFKARYGINGDDDALRIYNQFFTETPVETLPNKVTIDSKVLNQKLQELDADKKDLALWLEGITDDTKITKQIAIKNHHNKIIKENHADDAFKCLSDYLPKSKVKGAAIWAGICAAALGVAGYLMSSKKDAA